MSKLKKYVTEITVSMVVESDLSEEDIIKTLKNDPPHKDVCSAGVDGTVLYKTGKVTRISTLKEAVKNKRRNSP